MGSQEFPPDFLKVLRSVQNKRPRVVIEHILKYGYVTTEELKNLYGYNHPPRAARDVRELGIPLETFRVMGSNGRKIGAYRFGDPARIRWEQLPGRQAIPRKVKDDLIETQGNRCAICLENYDAPHLQVDHRVPYEVGGDKPHDPLTTDDFMLLCGSCNRAKSWSCEHCPNWQETHSVAICQRCYWANPVAYEHVALRNVRRVDVVWTEEETAVFDALKQHALVNDASLQDYIKAILDRHLKHAEDE